MASVFKLDEGVVIANLDADKHRDLAEKYVLCLHSHMLYLHLFPFLYYLALGHDLVSL